MAGSDNSSGGFWAWMAARPESMVRADERVGLLTRGGLTAWNILLGGFCGTIFIWCLIGTGYSLFGGWPLWLSVLILTICLPFGGYTGIGLVTFAFDVRQHYWRKSPLEQTTGPAVADLLEAEAEARRKAADTGTHQATERVVVVNAGKANDEAAIDTNARRRSQFAQFVSQLPHRGTDLRKWETELGRETYQEYRDILIRLGWAAWRGKGTKHGWVLVVPVDYVLARIQD